MRGQLVACGVSLCHIRLFCRCSWVLNWSVTHRCEVGCEEIYKYLFRSYAELEEDARAGKLGKIDEQNVAIKGGRRSVETKKKVQDTFNLHINSAWNESYSASFRSQLLDLLDFEDYKEALAVEMKGLGGTQSLKPAMVMPMPKQTSAMVRSALPRLGQALRLKQKVCVETKGWCPAEPQAKAKQKGKACDSCLETVHELWEFL